MGKFTKVVGAAGVVASTVYLSKSKNRKKIKGHLNRAMKNLDTEYVKELGKPIDMDDSEMVDEGALTSVQYYNELQQKAKNADDLKK
ncbi:hypothetical protein [Planococcus versutus]|uniref:Uncharacterized protein n=1 Tax=Planococcus versutus TaxID=1302659 RepID=A0A1B1S5N5_9BACL|nr:hypothetical protein [Planococcus versutus]ANU28497.1 hypothetical protein I858_016030 [Planococcus versutus]